MIKAEYSEKIANNYVKHILKQFSDVEQQKHNQSLNMIFGGNVTLKKILPMQIEEMLSFIKANDNNIVQNYDKLKEIFKYDGKFQPDIKEFFETEIKPMSCHYCNMTYINSFENIVKYDNVLEFLNFANQKELNNVFYPKKSKKIIDLKQSQKNKIFADVSLLKLSKNYQKKINHYVNKTHTNMDSHFTLDHVLDKSSYPLFALSIFNLVPSCSACNSKFKLQKQFVLPHLNNAHLSPTSKNYRFNDEIKFSIDYKVSINGYFSAKDINRIYLKPLEPTNNNYIDYIRILKLDGRYNAHKNLAAEILNKKLKYNESRISEIASLLNLSPNEVKEDIFGISNNGDMSKKIFSKFMKDITNEV